MVAGQQAGQGVDIIDEGCHLATNRIPGGEVMSKIEQCVTAFTQVPQQRRTLLV